MRAFYDALGEGDYDAAVAACHPDIVWEEPLAGPVGGAFRGRAEVLDRVFGVVRERYERFYAHVEEVIEAEGERVVVLGHYDGRAHNGTEVRSRFAHIWEMRDGVPIRFRDHHDRTLLVTNLLADVEDALRGAAQALAEALAAKDSYTAEHAESVAEFAVHVGAALGCDDSELHDIGLAAVLHDVGKIAVPDAILQKPRELTRAEYDVVKQHPMVADRILAPLPALQNMRAMVRHEHEHWDGHGYPHGLAGEDIPLGARVIAVVDAYHAMTSDRPYRPSMTTAAAREELRVHAGSQFDQRVVRVFLELLAG